MKKTLLILAALTIILTSCGGKSGKALLQTVPADSEGLAVVEMKKVMADLGNEGRQQLDKAIARLQHKKGTDAKWEYFFSSDSEVDFSAPLVAFVYKRATLFTFYVKDEGKFRSAIEEKTGSSFEEMPGGISALADNTVFLQDHQAWFAPEYPQVDASDIAELSQLSEKESIAGLPFIGSLADGKDDVSLLLNLDRLFEAQWNRQGRMALNMVFDDASYLVSRISFKEKEASAESVFLNYKGEQSSFAFKTSKIDTGALKDFDAKGNFLGVMGVNPDLMHSLVSQLKNFGAIPYSIQSILEEMDGNIAVSAGIANDYKEGVPSSLAVMMTFKSKEAADNAATFFRTHLAPGAEDVNIFTDDKRCYFIHGPQTGDSLKDFSDELKGANIAMVMLPSFLANMGYGDLSEYLDSCILTVKEESKGAKIYTRLNTKGSGNSIIALLKILMPGR